jgi:simple sugar transport system permease protein
LKATPLMLCAIGLAVCFRANVWNIGAEGQLIAGAIAGGAIALLATPQNARALGPAILVAILLAAAIGAVPGPRSPRGCAIASTRMRSWSA